ncbi:MAG TPA: MarR family transcriptional regulator [Candidatus Limnocylindrales bacterium]
MASQRVLPARRELIADIIAQFRSAFGELRCIGSQRLLKHGISAGHLHVASMLERHGGLPMSRLAELLDVSLPGATGIVDRMEERGLVERSRVAGDRRVVLVQVTDQGRRLLDDVEVLKSEFLAGILDRLPDDRLEAVAGAVADLRSAVEASLRTDPELFAHYRHDHREPSPKTAAGREGIA